MRRIAGLFCLCVAGLVQHAAAANLLLNGDFSGGNTNFSTGYIHTAADPTGGYYSVDTTPQHFNSLMANFPDHTSGTGQMMILDGALAADVTVWQETIAVVPNSAYQLSAFAASAGNPFGTGTSDQSPATLAFSANGTPVGSALMLPALDGQWANFTTTINSGSSSTMTIRIVDTNIAFSGNDFALDDLSLVAVPEPTLLGLSGVGLAMLFRRRRQLV